MTATERPLHLSLIHDATKPGEDLTTPHMAQQLILAGQEFVGSRNNGTFPTHTSAWRQEAVRGGYLTVITNQALDPRHTHLNAAASYLHTGTGILRVAAGYDEEKDGFSVDLLTLPNTEAGVAVAEGFVEADMQFVHMESDLIPEVREHKVPQQYDVSTVEKTVRKLMTAIQRIDTPTGRLKPRERLRRIASYMEYLFNPQ